MDLDFKTGPTSDDLSEFRGDRPTELGDLALKKGRKKETSAVKHKTAGNYRSGGLITSVVERYLDRVSSFLINFSFSRDKSCCSRRPTSRE